MFDVFRCPAGGALRSFWMGLLILLGTFAFKHLLISWALTNASTPLGYARFQLDHQVEMAELRTERNAVEDDPDRIKALSEQRDKLREDFEKEEPERNVDAMAGSSAALGKLQWFLSLKLLLDLGKLVAIGLIVMAGLHILIDDKQTTALKSFVAATSCILLFASTLGAFWTMLG